MKTYSSKKAEVQKDWVVIDADGAVVGRLASFIARRLKGKHKPTYSPHIDCGDHVVVVNADKVLFTGRKRAEKTYYRHTGYPGGIREVKAGTVLSGSRPEAVLYAAVRRMLARGPLGRACLSHLRVYAREDHPHIAQKPELLAFRELNAKNGRRPVRVAS